MTINKPQERFHMPAKQGRDTPNQRRDREMRNELIIDEMASAVRLLGGDGPAKQQNNTAARVARLSVTIIERLRWRKIKRVPADIADTIREAVERHNEESLARAKHEAFIARRQAEIIAARLSEIDPDFYGSEIDRLRSVGGARRASADRMGGE
jgi:hypothetical protein